MPGQFEWMDAMFTSPILMVLAAFSVVTLTAVIERTIYFWKRRGDPDQSLKQALDKLAHGATDQAAWICESSPHPFGSVAREVLKHHSLPEARVEERMQVALSEEKLKLEHGLGLLGTMAAVAPLVGLLGTVWGIMRAFRDMAMTGSAAPSVVAAGVAEALITTAAGLVVAVPAVILFNHFSRRMNVMLTIAENHARKLRSSLVEQSVAETTASANGSPDSLAAVERRAA